MFKLYKSGGNVNQVGSRLTFSTAFKNLKNMLFSSPLLLPYSWTSLQSLPSLPSSSFFPYPMFSYIMYFPICVNNVIVEVCLVCLHGGEEVMWLRSVQHYLKLLDLHDVENLKKVASWLAVPYFYHACLFFKHNKLSVHLIDQVQQMFLFQQLANFLSGVSKNDNAVHSRRW